MELTFTNRSLFRPVENPQFTFIDLFAGIGGFRIAMQHLGGKCVFSSEIDAMAQSTYCLNFGETPYGDITLRSTKDKIPTHFDVLCAGFPCQAFSIAGLQRGFNDARGTLFFDVATILREHRPKAFFLENVKNLKHHDGGKTFQVIRSTLEELGYVVYDAVLNSMYYTNVPQNRERIFIIGFDPTQVPTYQQFTYPSKEPLTQAINDCIDYSLDDPALFYTEHNCPFYNVLCTDVTESNTIYQWRRKYVRKNQSNVCPTLTANMGTGGHNVPIIKTPNGFRKLSPRECLNFQGYPKEYRFPDIPRSKCYQQAGNSVTVPLIEKTAKNLVALL